MHRMRELAKKSRVNKVRVRKLRVVVSRCVRSAKEISNENYRAGKQRSSGSCLPKASQKITQLQNLSI